MHTLCGSLSSADLRGANGDTSLSLIRQMPTIVSGIRMISGQMKGASIYICGGSHSFEVSWGRYDQWKDVGKGKVVRDESRVSE